MHGLHGAFQAWVYAVRGVREDCGHQIAAVEAGEGLQACRGIDRAEIGLRPFKAKISMNTTLEQIKVLQHKLRAVQRFAHMRSAQDCHGETARVADAGVALTLCWQSSTGSKNYHHSTEEDIGDVLAKALNVDHLFMRSEALLKAEITKLKISREAELKVELAEIEKLKMDEPQ